METRKANAIDGAKFGGKVGFAIGVILVVASVLIMATTYPRILVTRAFWNRK
jgi:hypothetical protein